MTPRPTQHAELDTVTVRTHRIRTTAVVAVVAAVIALGGIALHLTDGASLSSAGGAVADAATTALGHGPAAEFGAEDGAVQAEPMSPFDERLPGIANLEPALLGAVQAAATEARADGVDFYIQSGWRSADYQQALFDEAVDTYGSIEEASRLVSPPGLSQHVSGDAVDIGPTDADSWMQQHGDTYGLCQTYSNEMWHFELATTPGGECPMPATDPSASRP